MVDMALCSSQRRTSAVNGFICSQTFACSKLIPLALRSGQQVACQRFLVTGESIILAYPLKCRSEGDTYFPLEARSLSAVTCCIVLRTNRLRRALCKRHCRRRAAPKDRHEDADFAHDA